MFAGMQKVTDSTGKLQSNNHRRLLKTLVSDGVQTVTGKTGKSQWNNL